MEEPIARRLLVMGCSRSGTTLLQSLLASHSRVHTFPETGLFLKALGMRGRVLPWVRLGLTAGKERKALAKLRATQTKADRPLPELPERTFSVAASLSAAADFLDGLAVAHGKDVWVEKTPRHVLHASRIGRMVPGVRCIHMLRKGPDVVASIVDRARKYPEHFPRQEDPAYGIQQWNRSLRATYDALQHPGHVVVFYDALVADVRGTLEALCGVIGLPFEEGMESPADRQGFTTPDEGWKTGTGGPIRPAESKFERLFDAPTRAAIQAGLAEDLYQDLTERAAREHGMVLVSGPYVSGAG